ncbi:MAG: glycosyltransferase involved in cell wall biosynthesis [Colwellia sp.]|jgi:glycosyltransferase involved in cell wall biosynthesis
MKRIKILFCIDNLVRGGTELQLIGLIERLDLNKYEPYLLTIRETDKTLVPIHCKHIAWNVSKLFSLSGLFHIAKLIFFLRKEKIDIVQTYFQDSTLFAGFSAWVARVKGRIVCFRDMGFWNNTKVEKALRFIYPKMTNYLCNAEAVSLHFIDFFKLDPQKVYVVPNGVAVETLPFITHKLVEHVCIVGNMTRKVKRTELFIHAAAIVSKSYPDIKWHIIGDGDLRTELEALSMDLGIDQKVVFTGRISNVAEYTENMQIGVICSDSEGLSNAILEYMFKGLVCVVTDVGGNPELIKDNETGLLVPTGDFDAIAKQIILLIENPKLKAEMVKNARIFAENNYSWDNCLEKHQQCYSQIVGSTVMCKENK